MRFSMEEIVLAYNFSLCYIKNSPKNLQILLQSEVNGYENK